MAQATIARISNKNHAYNKARREGCLGQRFVIAVNGLTNPGVSNTEIMKMENFCLVID